MNIGTMNTQAASPYMPVNAQKTHKVFMKTPDMLFSGGNGTGLSFTLKYAPGHSKDDPIVIAKGVDENGREFEQTIDVRKVDPRNTTIVEMRALEAVSGAEKQYGFTSLPLSCGDMGLYERRDFMASFRDTIRQQDILGQRDNARFYRSSMQTYQRFVDKMNGNPGETAPYDHLAKDGQIEFNGVVFVCDPKHNQLRLGDCSNPNNCLIVPLEGGGTLMVNHNNLGDLTDAITMFSPADQRAILQALTAYNKIKEMEKEIDDETSSLGDSADATALLTAVYETEPKDGFIAKSVDPEEFYKAWMNQGKGGADYYFGHSYDVSHIKDSDGGDVPVDPVQFIRDRIDEMFVKLQNGDIEPKFVIGSSAFTLEEWDKFIENFDSQEEALRKLMAEEAAKKQAEDAKFEAMNAATASEAAQVSNDTDARIDMLLSDAVLSRFSTGQVDDNGIEIEDIYMTAMDKDGVRCSKSGHGDYLWEIRFDDEQQYEKAKEFLDWAGGYMDNFRFAAHETFWKDLLNDGMDEDAFRDFLANSTKDGKPVYTYGDAENMYIDRDKIQWAKYMNRPGSFVVIEDIEKHLRDTVADKQKNLAILPNPITNEFAGTVKEQGQNDEPIFCRYPGSELYSSSELARIIYEQVYMRFML